MVRHLTQFAVPSFENVPSDTYLVMRGLERSEK